MEQIERRSGFRPIQSRQPHDAPPRVALFNVKYSPNLGDGLLSECLEAELIRVVPGLTVRSFDLAGRTDYGAGSRSRGAALGLLQNSPRLVRQAIVRAVLGRSLRRLRPIWRRELADVDIAVTGGGNLFDDADLNFPLKISAAWDELARAGIPAAVFGVGVTDNWSSAGEVLFRRALAGTRIIAASVRDTRSAEVWNRRFGASGLQAARVVRDPGLLVSRHVPRRSGGGTAPLIGLGLTHPVTLRYHSGSSGLGERALTDWYVALVRGCRARGWRVGIFTNGSPEDEAYLNGLRSALDGAGLGAEAGGAVAFAPRFPDPTALASFISGLDLLMAHRLHANIAAYSYAVPQIGFSWDIKLKSFFDQVGRGDYLCAPETHDTEAVLALAEMALRTGIDPVRHRAVLDDAAADVADLAAVITAATRLRRCSPPIAVAP